ncbi:hypothetical protein ACIOGX_20875 [Streptomyces sp. NPDC088147]|uniref:hypothetical protein n=1 Tax=Streptomyces sp. NPDC088147 TaxID=3365830 RepID=UPI00382892D8
MAKAETEPPNTIYSLPAEGAEFENFCGGNLGGEQAYIDLDTKADYAEDALRRGSDAVWVHYTKSSNLVSFSVVCCPHRFLSRIPCPMPLL